MTELSNVNRRYDAFSERARGLNDANRLLVLAAFQMLPHTPQQHSEFDRHGGCHESDKHFEHDANHLASCRRPESGASAERESQKEAALRRLRDHTTTWPYSNAMGDA
jgi:hypothetical protein